MKPRISYISIATNDLQRSFTFYKDGLGLPTRGIKKGREDHASFNLGNGLNLVVYDKKEFLNHGVNNGLPGQGSGLIISHYADSKEEVTIILQKALNAGARQLGVTNEEPWRCAVNFADPDGYQWEIVWEA